MNLQETDVQTPAEATDEHTEETQVTNSAAEATPPARKDSKKIVVAGIALLVVAAVLYVVLFKSSASLGGPAAVVNGAAISQIELDNTVDNLTLQMSAQGYPVNLDGTKEQIKNDALNRLINTELLIQAAEAVGYTASDEEVSAGVEQLVIQFGGEDAFKTHLQNISLSEEMMRADIYEQLVVDKFLKSHEQLAGLTAEDTDVVSFYESLKTEFGDQVPPLEEIRGQIEQDLVAQKQQTILSEILAELRAEATVTISE